MTKRSLPLFDRAIDRRKALLTGVALLGACAPMMRGEDVTGFDALDRAAPEEDAANNDARADAIESGADAAIDAPAVGEDAATDSGSSCPASAIVVGPASMFAVGSKTFFSRGTFFVLRDAAGYYALTASCTHEGTTILAHDPGFRCPDHGSTFDDDGNVTGGPAPMPLVHFPVCAASDGRLAVDTSRRAEPSDRFVP